MAYDNSLDSALTTWVKVLQNINPVWSWWFNSTRQTGLVIINQMQTGQPEVEQAIVTEAASYGKQLGRVVEALNVLCAQARQPHTLNEKEQKVLDDLATMAVEIAAVKAKAAPTLENLQLFERDWQYLKDGGSEKTSEPPKN